MSGGGGFCPVNISWGDYPGNYCPFTVPIAAAASAKLRATKRRRVVIGPTSHTQNRSLQRPVFPGGRHRIQTTPETNHVKLRKVIIMLKRG